MKKIKKHFAPRYGGCHCNIAGSVTGCLFIAPALPTTDSIPNINLPSGWRYFQPIISKNAEHCAPLPKYYQNMTGILAVEYANMDENRPRHSPTPHTAEFTIGCAPDSNYRWENNESHLKNLQRCRGKVRLNKSPWTKLCLPIDVAEILCHRCHAYPFP
jgi:hypothetical protein